VERVVSAQLEDGYAAAQLIERLGWTILDAEDAEVADLVDDTWSTDAVCPRRPIGNLPRLSERALAA